MLVTVTMLLQPHSPHLLLLQNLEDFGTAIASSTSCLHVWFLHLSYHGFSTLMCHLRRVSWGSFIHNLKLSREQTKGKREQKTKPCKHLLREWTNPSTIWGHVGFIKVAVVPCYANRHFLLCIRSKLLSFTRLLLFCLSESMWFLNNVYSNVYYILLLDCHFVLSDFLVYF